MKKIRVLKPFGQQKVSLPSLKALAEKRGGSMKKIRVLVAKPGLDGHDRGAKVMARALRDAGFEVVYTGIRQTPQQIASAAVQEDVDAVCLSILSGAHNELVPEVIKLIKKKGHKPLFIVGGIIPKDDIPFLKKNGVAEVYGPGTPMSDAIVFIKTRLGK